MTVTKTKHPRGVYLGYGTKKCYTCKNKFAMFDNDWGYTQNEFRTKKKIYFCSYSCMREYEKANIEEAKKRELEKYSYSHRHRSSKIVSCSTATPGG